MSKERETRIKIIEKHKKAWIVAFFAMVVFFSCCLFPLNVFHLNFSTDFLKYVIFIAAFVSMGTLLAYLHLSNGNILKNYAYVLAAMAVGLGARYLLEYGEISNVYNFTGVNVYVFILGVVMFVSVGYLPLRKTIIKATNVKFD